MNISLRKISRRNATTRRVGHDIEAHDEDRLHPVTKDGTTYTFTVVTKQTALSESEEHFLKVVNAISEKDDSFRLGLLGILTKTADAARTIYDR